MMVPAEMFEAVLLAACRASVILAQKSHEEPTGIEVAERLGVAAEAAAQRIRELVNGTAAPDREALAKSLGWPSSDALVSFLFDGPSAGGIT